MLFLVLVKGGIEVTPMNLGDDNLCKKERRREQRGAFPYVVA